MAKSSTILFWSSSFLLICLVVAAELPSQEERLGANPILTATVRGVPLQIPRFRTGVELSQDRYAFHSDIVHLVKVKILKLTDKALIKRATFGIMRDILALTPVIKNIYDRDRALDKVDTGPSLNSGLGLTNGEMLTRMLYTKSGEKVEQITPEEAQNKMQTSMDAIEEFTEKSNTGLALEWPKMKVGDKSLEEYMKPAIQKLIKSNYAISGLLKGAAKLLKKTYYDKLEDKN